MMNVRARSNSADVRADLQRMKRDVRTAVAASLNVAAAAIQTQGTSGITQRYRIAEARVDRAFSLVLASANTLRAVVDVRGRPLSLAAFNARQVAAGVVVNIKGQDKLIRGAFLKTLRTNRGSEYQVVFVREGKARYPIKALKTIDLPGAFSRTELQRAIDKRGFEAFQAELNRRLSGALT